MTSYRPPPGGFFRLSGPSAGTAAGNDRSARPAEEARVAIRQFVRVLERLDRQVSRVQPSRTGSATRSKQGSKRR
jgi:hypothetical protein